MGQECDEMGYVKQLKLQLVKWSLNATYQLFWHWGKQRSDRVVFATMRSSELNDNLRAVYQQFVADQPHAKRDLKVLTYHYDRSLKGKVQLLAYSVRSLYYLATARLFIVDDYFFPLYAVNKHDFNQVAQLWHAIGTLKKFGLSLKQNSRNQLIVPHSNYDMVFINAPEDAFAYQDAFVVRRDQIHACGMPMMDELVHQTPALQPPPRKVLLYSPTYRAGGADVSLQYIKALVAASSALTDDWEIYISLHPYLKVPQNWQLPANVHLFLDPQKVKQIMPQVTVFITDYSSLSLHFSYFERPILLYAPDWEQYLTQHGFYVDYLKYMNAPVFKHAEQLIAFINDKLATLDCSYVQTLKRRNFPHLDGNNSKRVYQHLTQVLAPEKKE